MLAAGIWKWMLEVYMRARSAGRTNDTVKHAIATFEQFMSVGPHKKPTVAPPTP